MSLPSLGFVVPHLHEALWKEAAEYAEMTGFGYRDRHGQWVGPQQKPGIQKIVIEKFFEESKRKFREW